jgi:predicted ATPase
MTARLVEMRIRGLRTLADVTLQLGGLTVLIGDNSTGKSSILEALRIARLVAGRDFMGRMSLEHVLVSAIRRDSSELKLDLRVEQADRNFVYALSFDPAARVVTHECIYELAPGLDIRSAASSTSDLRPVIIRGADKFTVVATGREQPVSSPLSLFEYFGVLPDIEAVGIIREALEGIDVHLPFAVTPGWAARSIGQRTALREPQVLEPIHRLDLFAANLANVYHHLRNSDSDWQTTLELLQLGLGPELTDVQTPTAGGGHMSLALRLRGLGQVPAFHLSGGQLAYLAFVALVQLDQGRTLLAFDEPEHHLHPALLGRVLQLFEEASTRYPVILATHSDRLLDSLPDPASAVLVCELDSQYRTRLRQLDAAQLEKWMKRYRGLGNIRAAGQLRSVVVVDGDNAA